jgi:hypothetical protein
MNRYFFSFSLVTVLTACGAETTPGAKQAPASATNATATQTHCASYCDWKSRCSKEEADCAGSCAADAEGTSKWRKSFEDGVASCFSSLACDDSDDTCLRNFALGDPAYPDVPVVQACLDKETECEGAFSSDYCHSLAVLTDEARANADSCKNAPCEEVRDCLKAAGAFSF